MDEHLKIYQLALKIEVTINQLEKAGYSLDQPFELTLYDLQSLAKRIRGLEEENLELKVKLVNAGVPL